MLRNQRRVFIYLLMFGMAFINYADRITLSIGGKRIAADLGLSNVQLGYLFSSFLWSYVICLLAAGVMTDRWGERKMAAAVIGLWSAAQIVTGAATGFVTAVLSRLGLRIGECATNSVISRVVREWAPASERGTAMAMVLSGSYAGPAVGAALVGMLIEAIGWRMAFVLPGALGFIWLVVWLAFYRRPEAATWLSAQEREYIISQRESGAKTGIATPATILQLLKCPAMWGSLY